jgi:hypothetical protein
MRRRGGPQLDRARGRGRVARSRERAFDQALRGPEVNEPVLREKVQEMRDNADEMRRERRRAAFARWGELAVDPKAKPELERHGRTLARIRRLQFLAATERKGEARSVLLERLARARDLERGRHERAMEALRSGSAAAADEASATTGHRGRVAPLPSLRRLRPLQRPAKGEAP